MPIIRLSSIRVLVASIFLWAAGFTAVRAESPPNPLKVDIDLSKPFNTQTPWRFVATQEPAVFEPVDPDLVGLASFPKDYKGAYLPGLIHLCLQPDPTAPCDPLVAMQAPPPLPADAWAPHYLKHAEVVYARSGNKFPLFLLQAASSRSTDGNQAVFTKLLVYDEAKQRFRLAYAHDTGRNNNEEDRFITSGPLQGSVVSVEPTANVPFAYWVSVLRPGPGFAYKQVLRYRSSTHYLDGNKLAVIDSEMPNIQLRLGLWHPGMALPLPAAPSSCPNPHLVKGALWCA
jgi:hypothetical protein